MPHEQAPDTVLFVVESPIAYTVGFASLLFAAACAMLNDLTDESARNVRSSTPSQTATLNVEPDFEIPVVADTDSTTSDVIVADVVSTVTV